MDDRILGDGEFVEGVLKRLENEVIEKKFKNIKELIRVLSKYYGVTERGILETRMRKVREARSILVYIGNQYLNKSVTEMVEKLGITQEAASIAKEKGRQLAMKKNIVDKLVI